MICTLAVVTGSCITSMFSTTGIYMYYTKCVIYMAYGHVFNRRMGPRQAGLFTPSADEANQAVLWGSGLEEQFTRILFVNRMTYLHYWDCRFT